MTTQKTKLKCLTEHNEHGIPVFVVLDDSIPVLVLDYYTVKQLLSFISHYLTIAEKYYDED